MLVVVGCQRSGTQTLAHLLDINHEVNFTYESLAISEGKSEVSWMATPHTRLFDKYPDIKIMHLVRHPHHVIASLEGIGFWKTKSPYLDYILKYLPGIKNITGPYLKSLYYWKYWNELLLKDYPRIQIEAIANAPILNSRSGYNFKWEDIQESGLKKEVETLAEHYGYKT